MNQNIQSRHVLGFNLCFILVSGFVSILGAQESKFDLTLDELFPSDRVLDVQITVDRADWNKIRRQTRNMGLELAPERKTAPVESPYTYVKAQVTIDGVELGEIGLRKKGFFGSQSATRPSLKVKLDFTDEEANIQGLNVLTFNNNRQDMTCMYQFLGYQFFNSANSPASRCGFAKITVNGQNLGIYSHVESARKPLLQRGFGNDTGTLYEGAVVDFYDGWEGSFDRKVGDDEAGRRQIKHLIESMIDRPGDIVFASDETGRGWVPTKEEYDQDWQAVDFDDSQWTEGRNGAGYETQSGYEQLLSEPFNFKEQLFNETASLCLRFSFPAKQSDLEPRKKLLLKMKYDDGFVAWLNGHQVASSNAPENLNWNSEAMAPNSDEAAANFQAFDISAHRDKLKAKNNVLAIQVLNITKDSSDMLCVAEIETNDQVFHDEMAQYLNVDAFYRFWAIEGLLGFWDGYAANRNNFFVYLNDDDDKFYFMPWGLDSIFVAHGFLQRDYEEPMCVKTSGRIAHKFYSTPAGRDRYAAEMRSLLADHWDEEALLGEIDRIEELITPHLCEEQESKFDLKSMRAFIRNRRDQVVQELDAGLPEWTRTSGEPPVIRDVDQWRRGRRRGD